MTETGDVYSSTRTLQISNTMTDAKNEELSSKKAPVSSRMASMARLVMAFQGTKNNASSARVQRDQELEEIRKRKIARRLRKTLSKKGLGLGEEEERRLTEMILRGESSSFRFQPGADGTDDKDKSRPSQKRFSVASGGDKSVDFNSFYLKQRAQAKEHRKRQADAKSNLRKYKGSGSFMKNTKRMSGSSCDGGLPTAEGTSSTCGDSVYTDYFNDASTVGSYDTMATGCTDFEGFEFLIDEFFGEDEVELGNGEHESRVVTPPSSSCGTNEGDGGGSVSPISLKGDTHIQFNIDTDENVGVDLQTQSNMEVSLPIHVVESDFVEMREGEVEVSAEKHESMTAINEVSLEEEISDMTKQLCQVSSTVPDESSGSRVLDSSFSTGDSFSISSSGYSDGDRNDVFMPEGKLLLDTNRMLPDETLCTTQSVSGTSLSSYEIDLAPPAESNYILPLSTDDSTYESSTNNSVRSDPGDLFCSTSILDELKEAASSSHRILSTNDPPPVNVSTSEDENSKPVDVGVKENLDLLDHDDKVDSEILDELKKTVSSSHGIAGTNCSPTADVSTSNDIDSKSVAVDVGVKENSDLLDHDDNVDTEILDELKKTVSSSHGISGTNCSPTANVSTSNGIDSKSVGVGVKENSDLLDHDDNVDTENLQVPEHSVCTQVVDEPNVVKSEITLDDWLSPPDDASERNASPIMTRPVSKDEDSVPTLPTENFTLKDVVVDSNNHDEEMVSEVSESLDDNLLDPLIKYVSNDPNVVINGLQSQEIVVHGDVDEASCTHIEKIKETERSNSFESENKDSQCTESFALINPSSNDYDEKTVGEISLALEDNSSDMLSSQIIGGSDIINKANSVDDANCDISPILTMSVSENEGSQSTKKLRSDPDQKSMLSETSPFLEDDSSGILDNQVANEPDVVTVENSANVVIDDEASCTSIEEIASTTYGDMDDLTELASANDCFGNTDVFSRNVMKCLPCNELSVANDIGDDTSNDGTLSTLSTDIRSRESSPRKSPKQSKKLRDDQGKVKQVSISAASKFLRRRKSGIVPPVVSPRKAQLSKPASSPKKNQKNATNIQKPTSRLVKSTRSAGENNKSKTKKTQANDISSSSLKKSFGRSLPSTFRSPKKKSLMRNSSSSSSIVSTSSVISTLSVASRLSAISALSVAGSSVSRTRKKIASSESGWSKASPRFKTARNNSSSSTVSSTKSFISSKTSKSIKKVSPSPARKKTAVPLYFGRKVLPRPGERDPSKKKCTNQWEPNLHSTREGCDRCLYFATEEEKKQIKIAGHSPRINLVRGGCSRHCSYFPRTKEQLPCRLCRKCFYDTHELKLW